MAKVVQHPIEKQLNYMLGMVISMVQKNHPKALEAGGYFSAGVDFVIKETDPMHIARLVHNEMLLKSDERLRKS